MAHAQFLPTIQTASPWSVDRIGRLIAGFLFISAILGQLFIHPSFVYLQIIIGFSLIVTSLSDRCLVRSTLLKLGAKEREVLFHPDGSVKSNLNKGGR